MEEKIYQLLEQANIKMEEGFKNLNSRLESLSTQTKKVDVEYCNKLEALLNVYKQTADKIARIEEEITKHKETIK